MPGRGMSAVIVALSCLAGPLAMVSGPAAAGTAQAPLTGTALPGVVPGKYIVVLKPGTAATAAAASVRQARRQGIRVEREFRRALPAYSARLDAGQLADVRRNPEVAFVEADRVIGLSATQSGAAWGLDRIDQRTLPLDGSYTTTPDGAGVTAYVVDTGIRSTHLQFGGRVSGWYTAIGDGRGTSDCNGHGTHVAGTIGSASYGVAKAVTLVPVRVLDCSGSGTTSGVIAGVDWVTANHAPASVANMSLGGSASAALDAAVNRSIAAGVTFTVAAGNANANACNSSPARVPDAITVGASTAGDARANYSNYGNCLDLFAPGSGVTSAWSTSDTATSTISGTSMAAPHVAGVAALYLATNRTASPATVRTALAGASTPGVVSGAGSGSPNRLLYSLVGGSAATPTPAPSVSATATVTPMPSASATATATPMPSASATATATPAPTSTSTTPPATGVCATTTATYTGTLAGPGASAIQPGGTFYRTTTGGAHVGCLTGPVAADFDLYLYRWSGSRWQIVGRSIATQSTETVNFSGAAGYYYWLIADYAGSGRYTLRTARP